MPALACRTRRPRRALAGALAGALAAAALLAAPTAARAQPACAAGDLASYLAPGFECELNGWRFFGFDFFAESDSFGSGGGFAPATDGSSVFLTPFVSADALGRRTFGFDLTGFAAVAAVDPGDVGEGAGFGYAELLFEAEALAPGAVISRAGFVSLVEGATITPGRTDLYSLVLAGVGDPNAPDACVAALYENFGNGSKHRAPDGRCPDPRPSSLLAIGVVLAEAERGDSPRTGLGVATASIDRFVFTQPGVVVPEPATVTLVAAGLLALGVGARRRGHRG